MIFIQSSICLIQIKLCEDHSKGYGFLLDGTECLLSVFNGARPGQEKGKFDTSVNSVCSRACWGNVKSFPNTVLPEDKY